MIPVFKSEVISDTLEPLKPQWPPIERKMDVICGGDK